MLSDSNVTNMDKSETPAYILLLIFGKSNIRISFISFFWGGKEQL
jgi:hypothetical protein